MIRHTGFENNYADRKRLRELITKGEIVLGGNDTLRIYGTLTCTSGKRMLKKNRVFFVSEAEAVALGFRPCGHCLRQQYQHWKRGMK
jgi:methylphosphotriester-DNA--protein-cysteine methyltransferase